MSATHVSVRRFIERAQRVAEMVATVLFAAIFVIFLYAIFSRYALNKPVAWPDELNMVLLLWATFLVDALVLSEREQVSFDAVYDVVGPRSRRLIGIAASIVLGALFAAALPIVIDYVHFLARERTVVLQWRLDLVYICFVIFWVAVIVRSVAKLALLIGPDWQRHVAALPADKPSDHRR